jgi:hypothetical protein
MQTKSGVLIPLLLGASLLAASQAWATTLPDSCGPQSASFNISKQKGKSLLPDSSADKATLVFVQRAGLCIGCSTTRVGVDGAWIGANKGSSYFSAAVDAGEHHVCANWGAPLAATEAKLSLTDLQTEAGKTYYFETVITQHQDEAPRLVFKPLSTDEGQFLVSRSALSVAVPKPK